MRRPARAPLRRLHDRGGRRRHRRPLRRWLGLGRVFLYGLHPPDGTLEGQAYAVRLTQSKLKGLILDSAYPADDPYYRDAATRASHRAADRLPGGPRLLGRPRRALSPRRPPLPRRRPLDRGRCSPSLLEAPGRWPRAPTSASMTPTASSSRGAAPAQPADRPGHRPARRGLREFSDGLEIAVECNDYPPAVGPLRRQRRADPPALGLGRRQQPQDSSRRSAAASTCSPSAAHLTNCLTWPAPPPGLGLQPPVPSGWRAPTSFPTLVLAGQVDDVTSVAEARRQYGTPLPPFASLRRPRPGPCSSLYFPFGSPAVGAVPVTSSAVPQGWRQMRVGRFPAAIWPLFAQPPSTGRELLAIRRRAAVEAGPGGTGAAAGSGGGRAGCAGCGAGAEGGSGDAGCEWWRWRRGSACRSRACPGSMCRARRAPREDALTSGAGRCPRLSWRAPTGGGLDSRGRPTSAARREGHGFWTWRSLAASTASTPAAEPRPHGARPPDSHPCHRHYKAPPSRSLPVPGSAAAGPSPL